MGKLKEIAEMLGWRECGNGGTIVGINEYISNLSMKKWLKRQRRCMNCKYKYSDAQGKTLCERTRSPLFGQKVNMLQFCGGFKKDRKGSLIWEN